MYQWNFKWDGKPSQDNTYVGKLLHMNTGLYACASKIGQPISLVDAPLATNWQAKTVSNEAVGNAVMSVCALAYLAKHALALYNPCQH